LARAVLAAGPDLEVHDTQFHSAPLSAQVLSRLGKTTSPAMFPGKPSPPAPSPRGWERGKVGPAAGSDPLSRFLGEGVLGVGCSEPAPTALSDPLAQFLGEGAGGEGQFAPGPWLLAHFARRF